MAGGSFVGLLEFVDEGLALASGQVLVRELASALELALVLVVEWFVPKALRQKRRNVSHSPPGLTHLYLISYDLSQESVHRVIHRGKSSRLCSPDHTSSRIIFWFVRLCNLLGR